MNTTVLLVEDEDLIRELYKSELERAGFNVDAFALGQQGIDAAKQKAYDLVLLDIMLPDVNGLEVLKQIKALPTSKNSTIVLVSNLGQDPIIKQGFDLGAAAYLIKSVYNPDQLINEIKNIIVKHTSKKSPE